MTIISRTERENLRRTIRFEYEARRRFWMPRKLTEAQIDNVISRCVDPIQKCWLSRDYISDKRVAEQVYQTVGRPKGFDPFTWFLIGKLIIDIITLYYRFI